MSVLDFLVRSIVIGAIATAFMDVWALFLNKAFKIPMPNWALVGRWFAHLPRGRFVHADIAASAPVANELAIGWIAHYAIGILYAAALLLLAGPDWQRDPTFWWPWGVGLVTVGAGWFILQPGMGAGIAASRRPNRVLIRCLNLVAHTVFAAGLFAGALALR